MSIESVLIWVKNYIQENEGPLVVAFFLAVLFLIYRGYKKGVSWGSAGREWTNVSDSDDLDGGGNGEADGD